MNKKISKKAPTTKAKRPSKAKLLSGGNPQIAKGDGDAPVQVYIAAMPDWKRLRGEEIDNIVEKAFPKVVKAVKWNSPFYGFSTGGWFLSFHCFNKYIKVAFFRGAFLKPNPPGASKVEDVRYLDIYEDDPFDRRQFTEWVKQAVKLPGHYP